jgi:aminoglycoside phosphotransferase (APT) family kinase protein
VTINSVSDDQAELQARLVAAVRAATNRPALALRGPLAEISGGYYAKTYGLAFDAAPPELDRPLILRVMPDEHHAAHEIAIQRSVAQGGYPAPAVRLADATDATLGRPFILMDRAEGQPLLVNLDLRRALATLPRILATLPVILAERLAALHRLDPEPTRQALAAAGVLDQVDGTDAMLEPLSNSPALAHLTELRHALDWLHTHEPPTHRTVVCHGDLHPLNLLAVGTNVTAVIDWTGARLADPAYDVACTAVLLAQAPLAAPAAVQPALRAIGRSLSRRLVKQYRRRNDLDAEQLRWHEAWQCTRILAEVANWRLSERATNGTHPFETSADGIRHELRQVTGIDVTLPSAQ